MERMTTDIDLHSGALDTPSSGVRRWLTKDERAALDEPKAARLSLARAIGDDSPAAGPVETWLNTVESDHTRTGYAADVRCFVEWLRDKHGIDADDAPVNLLAVTRPTIAEYANDMREMTGRYGKPLSNATRARRLSSLSALYGELASSNHVPFNPVRDLKRPKVDPAGKTPARTIDEINRMFAAADGDRLALMVLLLLATSAIRVTELCNARAENITYADGRWQLTVPTKGSKHREVILDGGVHDALTTYLDGRADGPLLLHPTGQQLARHHVSPILLRLAKAAGLHSPGDVTPHVLRTTLASHLINAGHPVQRVQFLLGHDHLSTTQKYHRRLRGQQENAALVAAITAELPMAEILAGLRGES